MKSPDMNEGVLFCILFLIMIVLAIYYSKISGKFIGNISFSDKYYQKVCFYLLRYEYFRNLSEENKRKFSSIVHKFNKRMYYHGRDGVIITDELKIVIAAGYAKLSMGNNFGNFYTFRSIVIFPKAYRDEEKKVNYLGKTSMDGYIALSWEDILKSEAYPHDGINLALHEFSHAIVIEMMQDQVSFELEYFMVRHIYYTAKREIEKFNSSEIVALRKYAYSSPHEFFSIAIELFFETPEILINYSWITYRNLCVLLRQNPLKNEIGKLNWEWIQNYPHEERASITSINNNTYGPFYFYNDTIFVKVNSLKSTIEVHVNGIVTKSFELLHKDILFATKKLIPASQFNREEYQFILHVFKNNDICSMIFNSTHFESVEKMTEIFRKIGLSY